MPRSVPDDDMMDNQQSMDLGHATKSPLQTVERRLEKDRRTNGASGMLIPPDRECEVREALERAAYTRERREARRARALRTARR